MAVTYTDIIDAMIEAQEQGLSIDKVILTDDSMDSFLADDNFTKATETRQKETIGEDWQLAVESGERNVLLASGEEFPL